MFDILREWLSDLLLPSKTQRYVSDDLSHFVGRGKQLEEQYQLLLEILKTGWITHPPHDSKISGNLAVNTNKPLETNEMYNPEVVCFCDIPFSQLSIHCEKYSKFGLAMSKGRARSTPSDS